MKKERENRTTWSRTLMLLRSGLFSRGRGNQGGGPGARPSLDKGGAAPGKERVAQGTEPFSTSFKKNYLSSANVEAQWT